MGQSHVRFVGEVESKGMSPLGRRVLGSVGVSVGN